MSKRLWYVLSSLVHITLLVSACQPIVAFTETPTLAPSPTTSPTALPSAGPVPTKVPTPEAVWTYETGAPIWGTPAISDGTIIFGSDDGNLYAVDTQNGGLKWKFLTQGFVRSQPAIVGGLVYFASDDGYLYALDADSGLEKWRTDIGSNNMPSRGDLTSKWDYQQSSPIVVDGTVFVGSGASAIYAIDAATGAQIWKFDTVGPVRGTPAVAGNTVFAGDKLAFLHALDVDSGAEKWRAQGCDIPSPLVVDGIVYCGSRATTDLRAWNAGTGELLWKFSFQGSWVESSPRISDDTLYIGSSDAIAIFAIDPKTGVQKWKFSTGDYVWCTPAISNHVVYIGSYSTWKSASNFYAVDAATGEPIWALSVPKGIVSSPVVENEVVYFGGLDGKLYAISAVP
jgi:eukaryotic-like serine/threonine-protein kinase